MNTQSLTPSIFNFRQHQLRAMLIEQRPWFAAKDLCGALGLNDANRATHSLDADEKQNLPIVGSGGGQRRNTLLVSESGMWALVFRSNRPEAKVIRKWVTKDVLPALFSRGSYTMPNAKEVTRPVANPVGGTAAKALPGSLPAGVLDARAVPTTTVGLLAGKVRMVALEGKQWYSLRDALLCTGCKAPHSFTVARQLPKEHRAMVQLFSAPAASWFVTETGIRLVLGARSLLTSQLTLNLA